MNIKPSDIKDIRNEYRKAENGKRAVVDIANRYGVAVQQIEEIVQSVERDHPAATPYNGQPKRIFDIELFKKLYAEGHNDKEISKIMGYNPSTVFAHRTKLGLPVQQKPSPKAASASFRKPSEVSEDVSATNLQKPDMKADVLAANPAIDIKPFIFDIFSDVASGCYEQDRDIRNNWSRALDIVTDKVMRLTEVFDFSDEDVLVSLYEVVAMSAIKEVPLID